MNDISKITLLESCGPIIDSQDEWRGDIKDPLAHRISPPEGHIYRWVRFELCGEKYIEDALNWEAMGRGGWQAVPHARHPEMPSWKKFIAYRGLMLAEWAVLKELSGEEKSMARAKEVMPRLFEDE